MENISSFTYQDLRDIEDKSLRNQMLAKFYDDFLMVYFPIPEQLDPYERVSNAMDPADDTFDKSLIHVVVAFNENQEMIGGTLFEVFPGSRCGLLSYFCVKQEYRKHKIGKILIDRASVIMDNDCLKMTGKECFAILLETNSPLRKKSVEDPFSPFHRLQILSKLGCDLIDFEFIQPPLEPGLKIDTNLVLLYLNRDSKRYLDGNQLLEFMKEYWLVTDASLDHPYFLNTISVLANKQIPLVPLTIENIQRIDYCISGQYPNPIITTNATKGEMPRMLEKKFFKSNL